MNSQVGLGWTGYLPHNVVPVHYNLTLRPEVVHLNYTGHVDIKLNISESTNTIVLNAKNLNIYNVQLRDNSWGIPVYFNTSKIEIDAEASAASFIFEKRILSNSNLYLTLDFDGKIDAESTYGFYRSSVITDSEEEQHLLSTQFENDFARKVFPCWDEPEFKASFNIILEIDRNLTALFNTEEKSSEEIGNNKKRVSFYTSPKMTTYNLAFAIGELEYIEEYSPGYQQSEPIRCRIYTLPGQSHLTRFSMNATLRSLNYLENEFQSPYQLNKLDLLAVPDHDAGAMENWGLLTFRQDILITDKLSQFDDMKIYAVTTIAHELTHQWFGNLLTMKWWSEFWLNEGFATYFGILASHDLYPEYNIIGRFRLEEFPPLRKLDVSNEINSVRFPVINTQLFEMDAKRIIYHKGAAVLSMLNQTLSKEVFTKNLRDYINQFKYQSVVTKDFYKHMLKDLELESFKNWIEYKGYPLITIKETEDLGSDAIHLEIDQQRFGQNDSNLWYINLNIKSFAPGHKSKPINFSTKSISFDVPRNHGYIIETGLLSYYQVQYPLANLKRLTGANLSSDETFRLLSDTKSLIDQGSITNNYFLPIIESLDNVTDPLTWKLIISLTNEYFDSWSSFKNVEVHLLNFKRQLYNKLFQIYGFEFPKDESDLIADLRSQAVVNLAKLGDNSIINNNKLLFNTTVANVNDYNSSFLETIFKISLMSPDPYYYETLTGLFTTLPSNASDIKFDILVSLPYTNPIHLKKILDWSLKKYPSSNSFYWLLEYVPSRINTQLIYWEFIKENWLRVKSLLDQKDNPLKVLQSVTSQLISPEQTRDITEFIRANLAPDFNIITPYQRLLNEEPGMLDFFK